jgi:hypothetical protein
LKLPRSRTHACICPPGPSLTASGQWLFQFSAAHKIIRIRFCAAPSRLVLSSCCVQNQHQYEIGAKTSLSASDTSLAQDNAVEGNQKAVNTLGFGQESEMLFLTRNNISTRRLRVESPAPAQWTHQMSDRRIIRT